MRRGWVILDDEAAEEIHGKARKDGVVAKLAISENEYLRNGSPTTYQELH